MDSSSETSESTTVPSRKKESDLESCSSSDGSEHGSLVAHGRKSYYFFMFYQYLRQVLCYTIVPFPIFCIYNTSLKYVTNRIIIMYAFILFYTNTT